MSPTSKNNVVIVTVLLCICSVSQQQNLRLRDALLADFRLNDLDNDNIPGTAGVHYPVYSSVPEGTSFRCRDYDYAGYFADVEADCQAYHVCFPDGRNASFLCVNGTVFHQRYFVCDWWFHFNCSHAPSLYDLNLFRKIPLPVLPPVKRRPYMPPPAPEPRVALVQPTAPERPEKKEKRKLTSVPKDKPKQATKPDYPEQPASRKPGDEQDQQLEPIRRPRGNPNGVRKNNSDCQCICDKEQDFRNKYLFLDLP